MSDSETSTELNINYQTNDGDNLLDNMKNKKPQSTDTDYYFNMLANPGKIVNEPKKDSETSDVLRETSSSISSRRSSSSSKSRNSSHHSKESRPTYEKINISPRMATQDSHRHNNDSHRNNNDSYRHQESHRQNTETRRTERPPEIKEPPRQLTPQELRMKKIDLLRKLSELKVKGYELTKEYDFHSSIEEMEYEYELLKSFADKRNGVKVAKNLILNAASIIEFFNDKYDPFDFHLSGWSEHMSAEVDNWEDVLGELYEKYKSNGKKMSPEVKLLFLIVTSAGAFHFSKAQASKIPLLDSVLSSNPGLITKMMASNKKESSQFMTAQEINLERQSELLRKKEQESKLKMEQGIAQQQKLYIKELEDKLKLVQSTPQAVNASLPSTINVNELRPTKTPTEVRDILNRLHNYPKIDKPMNTETQDETSSQNDRLLSESNVSESGPKRGRRPKRAGISIM